MPSFVSSLAKPRRWMRRRKYFGQAPRLLLATGVPMLCAIAAIVLTSYFHSVQLAAQQRRIIEAALVDSKKAELRNYVQLALSALPDAPVPSTAEHARQVMATLERLGFGSDGYYFLYDRQGVNLMHPRQRELVGRNLFEMKDPYGGSPIKDLLKATGEGGGFVRYFWHKPSSTRIVPKLGYVEPVPPYGWMLGTGLYLDDVERSLQQIDEEARTGIHFALAVLLIVATCCIVLVGGYGLAVHLQHHRLAAKQMRRLARQAVRSQEDERARVARELHDGIGQLLVSVKLLLETSLHGSADRQAPPEADAPPVRRALDRLNLGLREIRRISHNLRPALLDDLGIAAALASMVRQWNAEGGPSVSFSTSGPPRRLPDASSTALLRICQEAVTNARRHSHASRIEVVLVFARRHVELGVCDNGIGFDVRSSHLERLRGLGLRSMRERTMSVGGRLALHSDSRGTCIKARLPVAAAAGPAGPPAT